MHPAPADVERAAHRLDVEAAEAEAELGVLVGAQALRRPGVHRGLRDLAVDPVAGARDDLAHALEVLVGPVDVALLRLQLRVAHRLNVPTGTSRRKGRPYLSREPPRIRRARGRRAVRRCAARSPRPRPRRAPSSPATPRRGSPSSTSARSGSCGSIATLPDPRSVELVGERAVVCHTAVGAVSVVARPCAWSTCAGLDEPRYVAAHPDGVHAFVTDSGRSGVVLVDVVRGAVLGRVGCRAGRGT